MRVFQIVSRRDNRTYLLSAFYRTQAWEHFFEATGDLHKLDLERNRETGYLKSCEYYDRKTKKCIDENLIYTHNGEFFAIDFDCKELGCG